MRWPYSLGIYTLWRHSGGVALLVLKYVTELDRGFESLNCAPLPACSLLPVLSQGVNPQLLLQLPGLLLAATLPCHDGLSSLYSLK